MQRNILTALSGLILPLAGYAIPAASSNTYQRSYLAAARQAPATDLAAHSHTVKNRAKLIAKTAEDELQLVQATPVKELVIIDAAAPDKATFYRAVKPGMDIVEIESSAAGLAQLKAILANYKNLAAVHIVSHAQAGSLQLGNSTISAETLKTEVETFAALNGAVREGGDLLLYGCDLASTEAGEELLDIVQRNTHLDVAASNDLTGNISQQGDWDLEIQRGNIEAELAFSEKALKDFSSVLATYTLSDFDFHDIGATTNCPADSQYQDYHYRSLSQSSFIVCGFVHDNGFGGTTVHVKNYSDTHEDYAFVAPENNQNEGGINNIEVRRSSGTFQLTQVVAKEFAGSDAYTGSNVFTSVKVVGYDSSDNIIESTPITNDTIAANTFIFTSGSHLANFAGVNLTKFRLAFVNEEGSDKAYMGLQSFDTTQETTPPTILSVNSSTANGIYKVDNVVNVQVNFSDNVIVTGTPQLTLETGSTDRVVNYTSGSGTSTLIFAYTIQAGDTSADLDYTSTSALALNGGTIRDAAANNVILTLANPGATNSLGANQNLVIDTLAPTIAITSDKATLKAGETATITFTLSENSANFQFADVSVSGGSLSALSGSGSIYTATFTPTANSSTPATVDVAGTAFTDAAGNNNTAATQLSMTVNTLVPTISSINRVSTAFSNATSVDYTVTFSEAVTSVNTTDFTLTATGTVTGTIASVAPVSASVYTVTVNSITGNGTLRLDLKSTGTGIENAAGNAIAAGYTAGQLYTFDTTAPAVASVNVPANGTYISGNNLDFTINFNEAITVNTGGGTPRIALTLGSSTVYASYVSGSGTSALTFRYTVQSGDLDANGIALASVIDMSGGTMKDAVGNNTVTTLNSVGSTIAVLVDAVAPAAPSTPDLDAASDTGVSDTDNDTSDNTPTFTGTAEANATVTVISSLSGSLGTTTADGSGNWSFTAAAMANGIHTITATATDAAGNVSSASGALVVTLDGPVTVTTNADAGADATIDGSLAVDLVDGSGLSLREALAYVAASGTVDFAVGLNGTTITLGSPLTVPAGITLDADALGIATITGSTFTLAGSLSVTNGSGDQLTLGSELTGAGALTKTGVGRLILTNTNNSGSYSGGVLVTAGQLAIGSDSAFSSETLTLNGGTLSNNSVSFNLDNAVVLGASGGGVQVLGAGQTLTLSGNISGSGALSKTSGGNLTLSGTNTFSGGLSISGTNGVTVSDSTNLGSGTVTINASSLLTLNGTAQTITNAIVLAGDATISNANAMTLSGVISNTGNLTKNGAGVLTFSGANTATGAINVAAGGLALSGGSAVADTVPVTVGAGATLSLPAGNETIGSLAGAGNVVLSYRLTTGGDNSSTTFSGVISSTNASGITKNGSGTFKLTGTNSYTGSTQLSAGSLIVNGSNAASSGVTVASGATLGGTGTVSGVTINSGGNLAPGDSGVGVLSIANGLMINSGGNLLLDIAGTTAGTQYDQLSVSGPVTLTGASLAVTHSYVATNGDSYTVIVNDLADAISGNFSGLAEGGVIVAGGNSSNLLASYVAGDGNDNTLTYTLLPGAPTAVTAVASNASASIAFNAPASNGGSAITGYTVTANPGGATVTGAGSPINFPGLTNGVAYTFTVAATNGTGTGSPSAASNSVTPSAPPVNAPPVITQGSSTSVTMSEDGAPTAFALSLSATDSDNDTLTWSVSGAAQHGSASVSGGSVSYIPTANYNGSDSFVVQISDGNDTASITVNVTITPVNDAPVISGTPTTSLEQDVAYSFTPTASDIDTADVLTFSIANKPTWASFNTATGALTGTPANADAGISGGIVISVSDGTATTPLAAFEIEVIATIDPLQPIVTAPADLEINATGLFTPVTLSQLLGLNPSATQAEIDLILNALASDGVSGNSCCTTSPEGLTADNTLLLPPGRHELKWKATNAVGLTGETKQVISVKPLVSLSKSQIAVRGSDVTFSVILNGDSPTYPLNVPYIIDASSTATAAEHNLTSGVASFTQKGQLEIAIPVSLTEVTGFSDSKLVVALGGGIHVGVTNSHTIDIRTGNVPPVISMSISQGGANTSLVTPNGGPVSVNVVVNDANKLDTHTFDWSATSGLADTDGNPADASRTFDPTGLVGGHQVQVTVTDSAGASVSAQVYFRVIASLPVLSPNTDTDQDGISDELEGAGDTDNNGIPDYLDNMPSPNILPQTGNITNSYLIECDPGVRCGLGLFARGSTSGGVQVLNDEIGSLDNLIVDPAFEPVGGIFDFTISDLPTPGQSVRIAIPQQAPIPAKAVYRKFQKGQWVTFISDADNALHSAAGNPGYCPPPGAPDWTLGLTAGHMCVQLTIEDGGPNDDDGLVNSAVVDPGAVSESKVVEPPVEPPKPPVQVNSKGGGAMPALWLLLLGGLVILKRAIPARLAAIALAVFSINTQAMENTYLRVDVFTVNSSHSEADFTGALEDAGNEFTLNNYDDSRTGFQIAAGYQWSELTYSEVGYLDLGDVEVNLTLDGDTDLDAFASDFAKEYPITATGVTLVQGLSFKAGSAITLSAEAGAFIWKGEVELDNAAFALEEDDGIDLLVGLKADFAVNDKLSFGLSGRRIFFGDQDIDLYAVTGSFRF